MCSELYTDLDKWIRFWTKKIKQRKAFQAKHEFGLFCFPCLENYLFFLSFYLPKRLFHPERIQITLLGSSSEKEITFHFTNKFSVFWCSNTLNVCQVICQWIHLSIHPTNKLLRSPFCKPVPPPGIHSWEKKQPLFYLSYRQVSLFLDPDYFELNHYSFLDLICLWHTAHSPTTLSLKVMSLYILMMANIYELVIEKKWGTIYHYLLSIS